MSDANGSTDTVTTQARRANWPLWIGSFLVGLVLLFALFGPTWAPKDPREHKLIIQVGDEWLIPPYPAFTPGYPLGSDNLGRDLFSWLLWSVRPTMVLVVVVASIRMALGIVIGVGAGWSDRWPGRVFDAAISAALSVPTLIAALIVITAVGFRLGVWAFVVGLCATGWAETAQLVRERTRTVRAQEAVEAARALGASSAQVFVLHILPQVMPMVWMLLAFEISNALVGTAGLGFLGYYLGGAVFTEVDDFVYQRISDMPELGQMLATAWMVLDEPWAMVAAGSVVFLVVLAFNLVGQGLQSRLTRKLGGARRIYMGVAGGVLPWVDRHLVLPVGVLAQRRSVRVGAAVLSLVVLSGGAVWWRSQRLPGLSHETLPVTVTVTFSGPRDSAEAPSVTIEPDTVTVSAFDVPGDHVWANDGHDPWRTRWVGYSGPMTTTMQWSFEVEGKLVGGPAIDADGVIYQAARVADAPEGTDRGMLYALDSDGNERWECPLPDVPVGVPALAADGTIYVSGKNGLSAVTPDGEIVWHFTPEDGKTSMAGAVVGPTGEIYYKSLSGLVALTPDGDLLWHAPITETMTSLAPHLSADGKMIYWSDSAFRMDNGAPATRDAPYELPRVPLVQVVVGADGKQYRQYDAQLLREIPEGPEMDQIIVYDWDDYTWQGMDAGVTPRGLAWLSGRPAVGGTGLGFYWDAPEGEVTSKISVQGARNIQVVGTDVNDVAYICVDSYESESSCLALGAGADRPIWRLPFRGFDAIAGAALSPGRLYVAMWDGILMAVGDSEIAAGEATGEESDGNEAPPAEVLTFGPEPLWERPVVPGDHPWPMPRRDAWGTLWTDAVGPAHAQQRWVYEEQEGLSGGPVVASDGTVYVGTMTGELVAVDEDGSPKWRALLPAPAVGTPAIGADGTIYVTDLRANLSAISPAGKQVWRFHPTGVVTRTNTSHSGQVLSTEILPLDGAGPAGAGPVVAPDGTIYYSMAVETFRHEINVFFRSEVMVAVSTHGVGLLNELPFIWSDREILRLSVDGNWVLWADTWFSPVPSLQGRRVSIEPLYAYLQGRLEDDDNPVLRVVIGADGHAYFAEKRLLAAWHLTPSTLVFGNTYKWDSEDSPGSAADGGATPDGVKWLAFRSGRFIWFSDAGQVFGPVRFPLESSIIALDADATVYGCGRSMGRAAECMAYAMGDAVDPRWLITLGEDEKVLGGALTSGVLYVTTESERYGRLYALGD